MIDIIPKDYELPLYLFHNGTNCETYKFLGCHKGEKDGIEGYYFRVWAAHAEGISVVGDFNDWDENATPMEKIDDSEVWEAFVTGLQTYDTINTVYTAVTARPIIRLIRTAHTWRSLRALAQRFSISTIIFGAIKSG